jgi:hypothetical protein
MLALCAIPLAMQVARAKNALGMSTMFLLLWTGGEICTLVYVAPTLNYPLIFNYIVNLGCLAVVWYYKLFEKKQW